MNNQEKIKLAKKEYASQWKKDNKEKVNEYNRKWRNKNKEKIKEYQDRHFLKKYNEITRGE